MSLIRNKNDDYFNNFLESTDFVTFTETWADKHDGELFSWDDNHEEIKRNLGTRNSERGRSSGGISFCADKTLSKGYEILLSDSYHIWYTMDKFFFGLQENLVICIR